jgi:hypothetical protein
MKLLIEIKEPSPSLPNEWVVAIRGLVDRQLGTGAPEGALRMTTIKSRDLKRPTNGGAMRLIAGLPNPIADIQRPGNDKTQALGAQAGGFWRSRRQRRKDL